MSNVYNENGELMARVMECHLLMASGAAVKVRAWFEDGVTQLHGLAAFGYEPISRDDAVEMFGVDQVQGLIRETEKNGEWVA